MTGTFGYLYQDGVQLRGEVWVSPSYRSSDGHAYRDNGSELLMGIYQRRSIVIVLSCIWLLAISPFCAAKEGGYEEADWGLGAVVRTATIIYDTSDESVSSFVPLMYYDGKYAFINGLEGGVKLFDNEKFRFDLLARLRFFDIPREYQNEIQGDTFDFGPRLNYSITDKLVSGVDILSDEDGHLHSNFKLTYSADFGKLELWPYVNLRLTSSDFNSYYYGLDREEIDSGTEFSAGISGRYHLWRNLYLIGKFENKWLGDSASESTFVDRDSLQELSLGLGVFNEDRKRRKPRLTIDPYLRVAHGWATSSNLGTIITGGTVSDEYNNQLTSLFYGYPLTDELFGVPFGIYLTPGFVYHWSSEVQSTIPEYVLAIKAYYTFSWPIKWRFGAAEGLSYVEDIPYVENSEMERKGYEPSNLMNYLDFSIDIDLGDLFKSKTLANWYLGYSIHHRSSIFESASQFGRISGGSNFNTVYLQYHF